MFIILATKPLNDGTKGFRFNFLGQKGFYRKRSRLLEVGLCPTRRYVQAVSHG